MVVSLHHSLYHNIYITPIVSTTNRRFWFANWPPFASISALVLAFGTAAGTFGTAVEGSKSIVECLTFSQQRPLFLSFAFVAKQYILRRSIFIVHKYDINAELGGWLLCVVVAVVVTFRNTLRVMLVRSRSYKMCKCICHSPIFNVKIPPFTTPRG